MARPRKYNSDDERVLAHRKHQTAYGSQVWDCSNCGCEILLGNRPKHLKSKKHERNSAR